MDIQGIEFDIINNFSEKLINQIEFFLIGTHSEEIHDNCRKFLIKNSYDIIFDNWVTDMQPDGILCAKKINYSKLKEQQENIENNNEDSISNTKNKPWLQ